MKSKFKKNGRDSTVGRHTEVNRECVYFKHVIYVPKSIIALKKMVLCERGQFDDFIFLKMVVIDL